MSYTHTLKTWPGPFQAVLDGIKTYEIRVNDRGYAVGDILVLKEWRPSTDMFRNGEYTGRIASRRVTYMTNGGEWGLPPQLCVLALGEVEK